MNPVKWLLIGFIKAWRAVVSPWYGDVCKYYPTCSAYGLEAVQTHGAIKGSGLIIWRLMRCNPWSMGGYDPVPGTRAAYLWKLEQAGLIDPDDPDIATDSECGASHGQRDGRTDSCAHAHGQTYGGGSGREVVRMTTGSVRRNREGVAACGNS